jgi:hypothetical protein
MVSGSIFKREPFFWRSAAIEILSFNWRLVLGRCGITFDPAKNALSATELLEIESDGD